MLVNFIYFIPIKIRAWIGFSARRYVGMSRDIRYWVMLAQRASEPPERFVLRIGEGLVIGALQFHADGEIIATLAAAPARLARMPSAPAGRDELCDLARTPDEKMGRYLEPGKLRKVRMRLVVQAVEEQIHHTLAAEFAGRQANVVDHQ